MIFVCKLTHATVGSINTNAGNDQLDPVTAPVWDGYNLDPDRFRSNSIPDVSDRRTL